MQHLTPVAFLTCALLATSVSAFDDIPAAPATPEHEWLRQFAGEWTTTSEGLVGPDQQVECTGTISSRMLGDLWVVNEMHSNMMGVDIRGLQTIGYDTTKQKYVGTWVDSVMNHMWHYEGVVDESGKKIVLTAEGPNFGPEGGTALYRDAYEFVDADHMLITSEMQGPDGEWITFMTGEARRNSTQP